MSDEAPTLNTDTLDTGNSEIMTSSLESMLPEIAPSVTEDTLPMLGEEPRPGDEPSRAAPPALSDVVMKIPVTLQVVIGTARVPLAQINTLSPGTTLTLEEKLGEPVLILVNGREVAKGELFVLEGEDNRLSVRIASVSSPSAAGGF